MPISCNWLSNKPSCLAHGKSYVSTHSPTKPTENRLNERQPFGDNARQTKWKDLEARAWQNEAVPTRPGGTGVTPGRARRLAGECGWRSSVAWTDPIVMFRHNRVTIPGSVHQDRRADRETRVSCPTRLGASPLRARGDDSSRHVDGRRASLRRVGSLALPVYDPPRPMSAAGSASVWTARAAGSKMRSSSGCGEA